MSDHQIFTPPCPLHTAVLFLIYKRPDTTRQVFEAIRQAKPPRLYVAADGPKPNVSGETERVQQARDIVLNGVDWDCEVKTLFRDTNLGCKYGVSGGITWFFEHEEEGIILEDDTLPSQSFFWFCQELLERYRDDKRVMCVAAQNHHKPNLQKKQSYFFSRYNHCWGWASWRRAWDLYDIEMKHWPELRLTKWLYAIGGGSKLFHSYWKKIFDETIENQVDSWAYVWTFTCWSNSGLTAIPQLNLIKNIGFSEDATHTKLTNGVQNKLKLHELFFPLSKNILVIQDHYLDHVTDKYWFNINLNNFIKSYIISNKFGYLLVFIYKKFRNIFHSNYKIQIIKF